MSSDERILVRATIHLSGLPAGRQAWVDPSDPYMGRLLRGEILVRVWPEVESPPAADAPVELASEASTLAADAV